MIGLWVVLWGVIGAICGSFLTIYIFRTHLGLVVWEGSPQCMVCHRRLRWHHNIPIISWLMLRGRCGYCQGGISWRYPIIELTTAVVFAVTWWSWQLSGASALVLAVQLFFIIFLLIVGFYDAFFVEVLPVITIPVAIAAAALGILMGQPGVNIVAGMAIGLVWFGVWWLASGGRWVGSGDMLMGFMIGGMLGWPLIAPAVILAYITGAVVAALLMLFRIKKRHDAIPLGPFLMVATWVMLLWGKPILQWYLGMVGF